jgi:hypothetical protein
LEPITAPKAAAAQERLLMGLDVGIADQSFARLAYGDHLEAVSFASLIPSSVW